MLLLAWHVPEVIIGLFPHFLQGTVQHDHGFHLRLLSANPELAKATERSKYLDAITHGVYHSGEKRWVIVDLRLLTSDTDETIAQMRDGRCERSWPTFSYRSFECFIPQGLSRGWVFGTF